MKDGRSENGVDVRGDGRGLHGIDDGELVDADGCELAAGGRVDVRSLQSEDKQHGQAEDPAPGKFGEKKRGAAPASGEHVKEGLCAAHGQNYAQRLKPHAL